MPSETKKDNFQVPPGSDLFTQRFFAYLAEKKGGVDEWSRLLFGANPALLVRVATELAAGSTSGLEQHRQKLKVFSRNLKSGISRILATADLIETLNKVAADQNADLRDVADVPEKLRAYAQLTNGFAKVASEESSGRLPKTTDYCLFFLHAYLLKSTGQAQWRGLATLLEAASAGNGHLVEVDDESVRKKIAGLRARDPQQCARIEGRVEEYVAKGNGDWPTRTELEQIAMDVALDLSQEIPAEGKPSK